MPKFVRNALNYKEMKKIISEYEYVSSTYDYSSERFLNFDLGRILAKMPEQEAYEYYEAKLLKDALEAKILANRTIDTATQEKVRNIITTVTEAVPLVMKKVQAKAKRLQGDPNAPSEYEGWRGIYYDVPFKDIPEDTHQVTEDLLTSPYKVQRELGHIRSYYGD